MADRERLRPLLTAVFDRISTALAGGERVLPPDMRAEEQAREMLPDGPRFQLPDFDEPEVVLGDGDPFLPEIADVALPQAPDVQPTRQETALAFAPVGDGRFVRFDDGMVRFTRGVGEAPGNKTNRNDPLYQERARFVTEMYRYALRNFDAVGLGQHRHVDAEVTGARSSNSDHYSGGAFDVRASSPEEAQRILAWASRQPWVSFAQVYPDGTLVHISAYIGYFAESATALPKQPTSSRGQGPKLPSAAPPPAPPAAPPRGGLETPRTPVKPTSPDNVPRRRYGQPSPF